MDSSVAAAVPPLAHVYNVSLLVPMIPSRSQRYRRQPCVRVSAQSIRPKLYSSVGDPEPPYLPPNFSTHVQPEGQRYHWNSEIFLVTEANLHNTEQLQRLLLWCESIQSFIEEHSIELPKSYELYLELGEQKGDDCKYYYVDHVAKTVFWLTDVNTDQLGISPTASNAQLRWAFTEEYWTHVEYFPSHGIHLSYEIITELLAILTQARADHLTSSSSTFPYTASQCSEFLDIMHKNVQLAQTIPVLSDANYIWVVARIWSQIAHHRFTNYYGEEHARLARDQCMLPATTYANPFYLKVVSALLFNEPGIYEAKLENIWIDEVVYAEAWKSFIKRCRTQWGDSVLYGFALIIAHFVCASNKTGLAIISITALALSACALVSAIVLTRIHDRNDEDTGAVAMFLYQTKHSRLGFKPMAAIYSLPKALNYWAINLLVLQILLAAVFTNKPLIICGVMIPVIVVAVALLTFARQTSTDFPEEVDESVADVGRFATMWSALKRFWPSRDPISLRVKDESGLPLIAP